MNKESLPKYLPLAFAVVAIGLLGWWLFSGPTIPLKERIPGADRADGTDDSSGAAAKWEGKLIQGDGTAADLPGAWPWFRGPARDGISADSTPLAREWPADGPPVLWKIDVGEGFAGAAIRAGRVYLMDYDHKGQADAFRCLSLADGKEIWRFTYPARVKRNHGMSRTIPATTEKLAVAISPKCLVICLDAVTGEFRWKLDLSQEFNTEVPPWYAGQCPFIDGDKLILGTGGDALVAAVELATGKVLWKSTNPNGWQMTHSSIAATSFKGQPLYVYCGSGGVTGVSATDGTILWDTPDWKISIANVPTPVPVPGDRLFLSGGYNAGALMLQMKEAGGKPAIETAYRLKATVFGSTQQTPILYKDHLFGVRPDQQLVCLDLAGKPVWTSGSAHKFGTGPYLIAQDMIYLFDDEGTLTLAEASTTGYRQLARARVLSGPDAWGPMALAGGRLVLRDLNHMACVDVGAK